MELFLGWDYDGGLRFLGSAGPGSQDPSEKHEETHGPDLGWFVHDCSQLSVATFHIPRPKHKPHARGRNEVPSRHSGRGFKEPDAQPIQPDRIIHWNVA